MARKFPTPNASQFGWLAFVLLVLTVYGSLIPLRYEEVPLEQAIEQFTAMGFHDLSLTEPRADWIVNAVQYALLSFCFIAALSVDRRWWAGLLAAFLIIPLGCAVAVGMEFVQIFFPPRTVSANDILVECTGVFLGCLTWLVTGQRATNWLRNFWGRKGLSGLAEQALPAYFGLLLVIHLMPFDLILTQQELIRKIEEGRVQFLPLTDFETGWPTILLHVLTNTLAFFPIGALAALLPGLSRLRWQLMFVLGMFLTTVVELLQLAVYTRFCIMTDVFTGTAGILLGWFAVRKLQKSFAKNKSGAESLVARTLPRFLQRKAFWFCLVLGWCSLLLVVSLFPFDFTLAPERFLESDANLSDENMTVVGLRRISWAPFVDYYWGSRYQALDQFVRRSLAFAPIGILLAIAFGERQRLGLAATLLTALFLGFLIEFGQYFIPERHPGVTDFLIQVFGAWLGFKLTRHVIKAVSAGADNGPVPISTKESTGGFALQPISVSSRSGMTEEKTYILWPPHSHQPMNHGSGWLEDILYWLDTQPEWVKIAFICIVGFTIPLAIVFLFWALGFA